MKNFEQFLRTSAGQRMAADYEKMVQVDGERLAAARQELTSVKNHHYRFKPDASKTTIREINGVVSTVKTDLLGYIMEMKPLSQDTQLTHEQRQELQLVNPVAFEMYSDGVYAPKQDMDIHAYYEARGQFNGKPLAYLDSANTAPKHGEANYFDTEQVEPGTFENFEDFQKGITAEMRQIEKEMSTEYAAELKGKQVELEREISTLEASLSD